VRRSQKHLIADGVFYQLEVASGVACLLFTNQSDLMFETIYSLKQTNLNCPSTGNLVI
jgi:hypothetical protein